MPFGGQTLGKADVMKKLKILLGTLPLNEKPLKVAPTRRKEKVAKR